MVGVDRNITSSFLLGKGGSAIPSVFVGDRWKAPSMSTQTLQVPIMK